MYYILNDQVETQDLAYDKGGGFVRCLTLFTNVDVNPANITSGINALDRMEPDGTKEEYKSYVSKLEAVFSNTTLGSLHWTPSIHKLTENLYGMKYKYEIQYRAFKEQLILGELTVYIVQSLQFRAKNSLVIEIQITTNCFCYLFISFPSENIYAT